MLTCDVMMLQSFVMCVVSVICYFRCDRADFGDANV